MNLRPLKRFTLTTQDELKQIRNAWMNAIPLLMFLERPNEVLPGEFVIDYDHSIKAASLRRVEAIV